MKVMIHGDIEEYYEDDDGDGQGPYEDKNLGQGMMKRREGGVVGGSVDVSSSLWRGKVFMSIVIVYCYYFVMRSINICNLLNVLY